MHVWQALTGQDVYTYPGHSYLVRMVAWSPDGKRIASASEDKTVQIWDASNGGNPLTCTGHSDWVRAVTWSPDGSLIASASEDKMVRIWDAATGKSLLTYTAHVAGVVAVAWSPKGNLIASASADSMDGMNGIVNVWDTATGATMYVFQHKAPVGSVAYAPDGRNLVTGDYNNDDSVRIWNINTGSNVEILPATINNQVYAVDWARDGRQVAAGYNSGQVNIWSFALGKQVLTYLGHRQPIMSVQWSHNSKYVASASFDKTVQIWEP